MESSTKHSLIELLKTYEQHNEPNRVRRKLFVTGRKDKEIMNNSGHCIVRYSTLIEKLDCVVI